MKDHLLFKLVKLMKEIVYIKEKESKEYRRVYDCYCMN